MTELYKETLERVGKELSKNRTALWLRRENLFKIGFGNCICTVFRDYHNYDKNKCNQCEKNAKCGIKKEFSEINDELEDISKKIEKNKKDKEIISLD